jgi:phosphate:Na+ symporter
VRLLRSAATASRLGEADGAERIAEESDLFLRTVRDLRRVHSHLASFAYPIIHRVRGRSRRARAGGVAESRAVNASAATPPVSQRKPTGVDEDELE